MSKYLFTFWLSCFSFISVAQIIQDINLPIGLINNPTSIQSTHDNGFIVAGNNSLGIIFPPLFSTTVIKLDSSLNTLWTITQPPRESPNITNSFISSDGGYLVNDSENVFNSSLGYRQSKILKIKPNGAIDWVYTFNYPFQNTPGPITELNNEIYMLWHCYTEDHNNINANEEWHIVKFSASGDSLGSINITNLSPPDMFFKIYKDLTSTSDNQLLLTGWGQSWLSIQSNPISQIGTVPLIQKIDLNGNLIWDYTEQPKPNQGSYQAQFFNIEELPCGDIVAFGVKLNNLFNGYAIRFDANGQRLNTILQNQIWNEFLAGTSYQNCGFISVGYLRLNISPLVRGSFIVANNELNQEVINTSIMNYPQVSEEVVYDICPLKNDPNKFALVMRNPNATRVVIIGAYQNELDIEGNEDQAEISISPNPSDGIFQVSSISTEPMRIVILDQQGKQVAQFELDELSSNNSFDLSEQAPGVYFAHVSQGEQQWIKKLVLR